MNRHFAELGDVWKHLPLAEILRINPPRHVWETHAGSASYPLTENPTRLHGALRFLREASGDPVLENCTYLQVLRSLPGNYLGSPALATHLLGTSASYIFCDVDRQSIATLQAVTAGLNADVFEADGVSTILREAQNRHLDPGGVLVHIDPFDPGERFTTESKTPLELAAWLANAGYRVFYWYGYDAIEQRGWAREAISKLANGVELWCGDVVMPASFVFPERTGAWGCGVVLANMTRTETRVCAALGTALEGISESDVVRNNNPPGVSFRVLA